MEFKNLLKNYKTVVDDSIFKKYTDNLENNDFKDIINYILKGGKRLRPIIIYEITQKMNFNNNTEFNNDLLGIILELLHSASLIIDDLPCMDNDSERRGQPSAHVKYGKTGAQLLSYSLIFSVMDIMNNIIDNFVNKSIYTQEEALERCVYTYKNLLYNLGLFGATMGQYLDIIPLYLKTKDTGIFNFLSKESTNDIVNTYNTEHLTSIIIQKKTTSLFDISFVSAYILSGGDLQQVSKLKKAVEHFGLAFQISDDFLDYDQDMNRKIKNLTPNYVINNGKEKSYEILKNHIFQFRSIMISLNLWTKLFNEISLFLLKRINYK